MYFFPVFLPSFILKISGYIDKKARPHRVRHSWQAYPSPRPYTQYLGPIFVHWTNRQCVGPANSGDQGNPSPPYKQALLTSRDICRHQALFS
jgi:hypothetical protein